MQRLMAGLKKTKAKLKERAKQAALMRQAKKAPRTSAGKKKASKPLTPEQAAKKAAIIEAKNKWHTRQAEYAPNEDDGAGKRSGILVSGR
jgi:hypothetical protein